MAEIERFNPNTGSMWPKGKGSWIRYSDHRAAITAELEGLAEEFEKKAQEARKLEGIGAVGGDWEAAASHLRERAAEYRQEAAKGDDGR